VLVGRVDELIKRTGCDKRSANVDLKLPSNNSNVHNFNPPNDRLVFSGKRK